jgi:hypothetical protein
LTVKIEEVEIQIKAMQAEASADEARADDFDRLDEPMLAMHYHMQARDTLRVAALRQAELVGKLRV